MKKTLLFLGLCFAAFQMNAQTQVLTDPTLEASGAANNGVDIDIHQLRNYVV